MDIIKIPLGNVSICHDCNCQFESVVFCTKFPAKSDRLHGIIHRKWRSENCFECTKNIYIFFSKKKYTKKIEPSDAQLFVSQLRLFNNPIVVEGCATQTFKEQLKGVHFLKHLCIQDLPFISRTVGLH